MSVDIVAVIDIGNTSTTFGLARGNKIFNLGRCSGYLNDKDSVIACIRKMMGGRKIKGAVLCSVVPSANMVWVSQIKRLTGVYPLIVNHKLNFGIKISYPKPATIGADRLANACGASFRHGVPVIVADFGTALTFDIVSEKKGYIGGVIAPGLPLMTDYLADKTALLPHIQLKGKCHPVGRSTESAMRIGAKIGYRGMVREIINYLTEKSEMKKVKLCATGGYAGWALDGLDMPFAIDYDLTLFGLCRIYELNRIKG